MNRDLERCDIETCSKALKLLRIQRHDFMNHLQVIHSMIQLGRHENALSYIDKIPKNPSWIADIIDEYNKG